MEVNYLDDITSLSYGMDVVIISVTSLDEEAFWKKRLDIMRGQIVKRDALIITVHEDWEKGAGNALGTFYAFQKAYEKALNSYQVDLLELLEKDKSIALYHTAGKGTRLAPMTGCEYNSKSRIKLAGKLFEKSASVPMTLLEAVIKQTSIFAPVRKGRFCVFWGDQIFLPSIKLALAQQPVDLLVKPISKMPTLEEWTQQGYDRYGFVITAKSRGIKQLEKLSYKEFSNLELKKDETLALSLGSFSLSKDILNAFLKLFEHELQFKEGAFDTDPHLWMPLTLEHSLYEKIMEKKKASIEFISNHYQRIQTYKDNFLKQSGFEVIIGSTSVGENAYWWDYGNRQSYFENAMKLNDKSEEAEALRRFFSIPKEPENAPGLSKLKVENSILINCSIQSGEIKNSVLINVVAANVKLNHTLIISSSAQNIEAKEAILYNCLENGDICIHSKQIRADNFSKENGHLKLLHPLDVNLPWDTPIEGNPFSFEEMHQMNQTINQIQGQKLALNLHNKIKQAVLDLQL